MAMQKGVSFKVVLADDGKPFHDKCSRVTDRFPAVDIFGCKGGLLGRFSLQEPKGVDLTCPDCRGDLGFELKDGVVTLFACNGGKSFVD